MQIRPNSTNDSAQKTGPQTENKQPLVPLDNSGPNNIGVPQIHTKGDHGNLDLIEGGLESAQRRLTDSEPFSNNIEKPSVEKSVSPSEKKFTDFKVGDSVEIEGNPGKTWKIRALPSGKGNFPENFSVKLTHDPNDSNPFQTGFFSKDQLKKTSTEDAPQEISQPNKNIKTLKEEYLQKESYRD